MDQRLSILKMAILPKLMYRFNKISIKMKSAPLKEETAKCQMYMKMQRADHSHSNLEKEEKCWRTFTS